MVSVKVVSVERHTEEKSQKDGIIVDDQHKTSEQQ